MMMETFGLYFALGREHILDYSQSYDHIMFVVALSIVYVVRDWKKVALLVTFFTIGHSITLMLATLDIIAFQARYIEFLIPLTIAAAAISNLFIRRSQALKYINFHHVGVLFFGFIHGMGFSYTLQAMLGKNQSLVIPLLAFNLGIEFGQLIIVCIVLFMNYLLISLIRVSHDRMRVIISAMIAGAALLLAKQNIFW